MSTVIALPESGSLASAVAANIRAESARRGLKQSDLAKALGVTHGTINMRWLGRRNWTLDDIEAVAKVLKVKPEQLLTAPADWYTPRDSNPEPTD